MVKQVSVTIINDIEQQLVAAGQDKDAAAKLLEAYGVPFVEMGNLIEESKTIAVKDEDDIETMAKAKEIGKKLQQGRLSIKATHDSLKADSLAYGKAVDLVLNVALAKIEPAEAHLKLQAKYAETQQQLRREKNINERTSQLAQYVEDPSIYNYGDMADDAFQMLLEQVKNAYELQAQKDKEAEEALIAAEAEAEAKRKAEAEADKIAREKAEAEAKELRALQIRTQQRNSKLSMLGMITNATVWSYQYELEEVRVHSSDVANLSDEEWATLLAGVTEKINLLEDKKKFAEEKLLRERLAESKRLEELEAERQKEIERIAAEKAEAEKAALAPEKEQFLEWVDTFGEKDVVYKSDKAGDLELRIREHLSQSVRAYRKLIEETL